jgi:hypothetical protein
MTSTTPALDLPQMTNKAAGHHVSYLHMSTKYHLELPIATTTEEAAFFASLDRHRAEHKGGVRGEATFRGKTNATATRKMRAAKGTLEG